MSRVPFTEEAVKAYLDDAIEHWRAIRNTPKDQLLPTPAKFQHLSGAYVDAYQSVRSSLFGSRKK